MSCTRHLFLFCRLPLTPCSHTRPRPLFCAASDEKQGGGLGTSDKKLGGAWEQGLQKFQSLYCTLAQPLFQGSVCYMQYNSVWLDSIASFHYGNWRALHYHMLADCITELFCPPVSMLKDAMESIYIVCYVWKYNLCSC